MTVGKVSLVLLGLAVSVSWKGSVDSKPTSLLDEERFLNCFGGGGMDFFCMWREWMQVQQLFNANPNGLGPEEISGYIASKIPGLPNPLPDEVNQIIRTSSTNLTETTTGNSSGMRFHGNNWPGSLA